MWVAGGSTGEAINLVEILSLETETWRTGPSMVRPRSRFTMEALENSVFVFGGWNEAESTMEKLVGEEWIEEPMQYKHADHASVIIPCN